jgi:AcrR family transcriptional regulator
MNVSLRADSAPARSRAETRRRLIASGTELFARRGLHGVTTHSIASAAGVAAGTFYLHFKDKGALFREIALAAAAELEERLERVTRDAADVEAAVRGRAAEFLAFAAENRNLVRILFGRGQEVPELASEILDEFASFLQGRLEGRIAEGVVDRTLHSAVASQALVGMIARVMAWWAEEPGRAPRNDVIETLSRLQLTGLGPATEDPLG